MRYSKAQLKRSPQRRFRPQVEALEDRWAPAVSVSISGGALNIIGDAAADTITIDTSGTNTLVLRSAPTPTLLTFATAAFSLISINTRGGNDTVNIFALPAGRPTVVFNDGGADVVNVGHLSTGVQGILSQLELDFHSGSPGSTTVNVNDSGNPVGRVASQSFHQSIPGRFFELNGLAPAPIVYPMMGYRANITLGAGADTFTFMTPPPYRPR